MDKESSLNRLLSCPFCGGTASAEGIDGGNVGCDDSECPAYLINCSAKEWNKRADLSNKDFEINE